MGYVPVHPVPVQVPLVVSSGPRDAESVADDAAGAVVYGAVKVPAATVPENDALVPLSAPVKFAPASSA